MLNDKTERLPATAALILEAVVAVYGLVVAGYKGHGGLFAAAGTGGGELFT